MIHNIPKNILEQKIKEGLDNKALAKFFSCSVRTICYRKASYNLSCNNNSLTIEEKNLINKWFLDKETIASIARKLNRSENTISNYLIKNKLHQVATKSVKDKKCPYCSYTSSAWKSVRAHVSNCSSNTHTYFIGLLSGPILLADLYNKNYIDIRNIYPNLSSSETASISKRLYKLGYSTAVHWDNKTAKKAINEWVTANNKVPIARDTYNNPFLPSDQWAKKYFNTWNSFIMYCGHTPNEGYGTTIYYKDGTILRSNLEFFFLDNYLFDKHSYLYEKLYPGNTNRISDFYLPEYDLYIELAGGLRPEVIAEKISYCKNKNLKLLVLYPKQVYSKNFNLDNILVKYK
jgi:hypothetical protein